ncbi:MAG: hypothetical protein V4592_20370 [Bacteroidota bacterium]
MKTSTIILTGKGKFFAVVTLLVALCSFKGYTQAIPGKGAVNDTVTYVLYNNDLNFDSKRTIVYDDKKSVDSLASILAAKESRRYRIIYRKEGNAAMVISAKYLNSLNRAGFYSITIAYNKPGLGDDIHPMYIITSK